MNVYSLGALINSITSLGLGILVYVKHREHLVNRSFLRIMVAVSLWSLGVFGATTAPQEWQAMWWSRILHLGSIPIPVLFLSFVFFVLNKGEEKWKILIPGWGVTFVFLALNFTPWFIRRMEPALNFRFYPHAGRIYPLFAIYFLVVASYGLFLLLRGYRQASGLKRNQLQYLFWSWLIGFVGGTFTFFPAMDIDIAPWGIYLFPVALSAEAYAIVKYRSMDINIVFRRGMVYSILVCLLTAVFLICLLSFEKLFRSYVGYSSMVGTAIAALILAIVFQPLKDKVQAWVDRFFFKGAYDYYNTLKKTSEAMTSILDLEKLIDHLLSPITVDMKVEGGSLLLRNRERPGPYLSTHRFFGRQEEGERGSLLPEDSAIVSRLKRSPGALMREGIKDHLPPQEAEEISQEMSQLEADLAIPVVLQRELLAILLLGPKLSGDPFSEEDLQLLSALANQAAVAIKNAQLYDEVASIKEYLENILRNLESGVITVDQEGRITTFNRAAEKMIQWKASETMSRDCQILEPKLAQLLLSTLSNQKGRSGVEMTLHTKEGKPLPVGVSTSLLQSQQGNLLGAIALFSDLTEVKELEREKWKAEKLAYIGTLAASIAHEIKNPLVSIKTLAQLLPERHGDSEFRDHFSHIALKEVDRIDLLVSQMLDLKGDSSPSHFESLRLEEIVEEILLLLSNQIKKQQIRLEREYCSSTSCVWGDRFQLKQAFWNVILNSVQAMERGGVLTVSTRLSENGMGSEEKIVLKISDTGNGIPEDHLGKIFDLFFTTKQGGTGLGLSICYKIVAAHRGNIRAESQLQQGTSFFISLPAIRS